MFTFKTPDQLTEKEKLIIGLCNTYARMHNDQPSDAHIRNRMIHYHDMAVSAGLIPADLQAAIDADNAAAVERHAAQSDEVSE